MGTTEQNSGKLTSEELNILAAFRNAPDQYEQVMQILPSNKNQPKKCVTNSEFQETVTSLENGNNTGKTTADTGFAAKKMDSGNMEATAQFLPPPIPTPTTTVRSKRPFPTSPDNPEHDQTSSSPTLASGVARPNPVEDLLPKASTTISAGVAEKRLSVIVGTDMPKEAKVNRKSLVMSVKAQCPKEIVFEEIKLTRSGDIHVICTNEHDFNLCLMSDRWMQSPFKMLPRFNVAAGNESILYVKNVQKGMDLQLFVDKLNASGIKFSALERIKVGKEQTESPTVKIFVHDKEQRMKLIKEGLVVDYLKYNLEPHIRTNVRQCYNCLSFGHIADDCVNEKACLRCGENHDLRSCPAQPQDAKCKNCAKSHPANDRSCATRLRLIGLTRREAIREFKSGKAPTTGPEMPHQSTFPPLPKSVISTATTASIPPTNAWIPPKLLPPSKPETSEKALVSSIASKVLKILSEAMEEVYGDRSGQLQDAIIRSVSRNQAMTDIDVASVARALHTKDLNEGNDAGFFQIQGLSRNRQGATKTGLSIPTATPTLDKSGLLRSALEVTNSEIFKQPLSKFTATTKANNKPKQSNAQKTASNPQAKRPRKARTQTRSASISSIASISSANLTIDGADSEMTEDESLNGNETYSLPFYSIVNDSVLSISSATATDAADVAEELRKKGDLLIGPASTSTPTTLKTVAPLQGLQKNTISAATPLIPPATEEVLNQIASEAATTASVAKTNPVAALAPSEMPKRRNTKKRQDGV